MVDPAPDEPEERSTESIHVRRAVDGDRDAIQWCVEQYSPWLLALARRRMPAALQQKYPPADLVQDCWLTVLPRLASIEEKGGRTTPVFMKFLMTTQLHLQNALFRKLLRGKPGELMEFRDSSRRLESELPAAMTGPVTRVLKEDLLERSRAAIDRALDGLGEQDRELVLQRMQGLSYREIADSCGLNPNQLGVRFHRAIVKLRDQLEDRLLDDYVDLAG